MPAASSSPIDPAIGHLAALADGAGDGEPGLREVLARVADPRHRRGVRHRLVVVLSLAVCAVLTGTRSFTAIAEWAADADEETLAGLGVTGAVPSESTFRRVLQRLDADAFDDLAGRWAQQRTAPGRASGAPSRWTARPYAAQPMAKSAADTSSRPSSAATGPSRTACTGFATWTTTRTAPKCAPPAAPASWQPCATWSSPSCAWSATPVSPPPCATTQGGHTGPYIRS
jgi:hypothetical protein